MNNLHVLAFYLPQYNPVKFHFQAVMELQKPNHYLKDIISLEFLQI